LVNGTFANQDDNWQAASPLLANEVVTPYTSAFLSGPGVTNITLQNHCVLDRSDHLEIAADPVALADVLNALDPAHPVRVPCLVVLPITGPVGPVPSF
jgi:hypothetical protein